MYCDDQAQLKNLDLNPRASSLAQQCGKMIEVRGDAFLARVLDNEDDFKRLDLTLQEIDSSSPWLKQALEISIRKQRDSNYQSQKDFLNQMSSPSGPSLPKAQVKELSEAEVKKEEGNAAIRAGEWERAISCYTSSLALDPSLIASANNRSLALIKLGRFQEAIDDCSLVLSKEPSNVKSLIRRASAGSALMGSDGSQQEIKVLIIEDVDKVLAIEPNNREALKMKEEMI